MDGENIGKPYEQMDDLGVKNHQFLETTPIWDVLIFRIFALRDISWIATTPVC